MQRILDIGVSTTLLLVSVALFAMTFSDQFDVPTFGGDVGPAFAPRGFLAFWFLFALISVVQAVRSAPDGTAAKIQLKQLLAVVAITLVTGYAMTKIGFFFAAVPGFFLFCLAFGYRNLLLLAVLSIGAPLLIWALFTFGFELLLPRSPWFNQI